MTKLCNAASAFFVRNPTRRDGFHPVLCYPPLTETRSAVRLMPVLDEIRRRRGCEISVDRPRIFAEEKRIKAFVGFAPQ